MCFNNVCYATTTDGLDKAEAANGGNGEDETGAVVDNYLSSHVADADTSSTVKWAAVASLILTVFSIIFILSRWA